MPWKGRFVTMKPKIDDAKVEAALDKISTALLSIMKVSNVATMLFQLFNR